MGVLFCVDNLFWSGYPRAGSSNADLCCCLASPCLLLGSHSRRHNRTTRTRSVGRLHKFQTEILPGKSLYVFACRSQGERKRMAQLFGGWLITLPVGFYLLQRLLAAFLAISLRRLGGHPLSPCLATHAPQRHGGGVLAVLGVMSSISPVAILAITTALPMASAGRFSPFGPRGMSLSPDNSFRFFEDFYAVPSAASGKQRWMPSLLRSKE